jgi:hypothetical protein
MAYQRGFCDLGGCDIGGCVGTDACVSTTNCGDVVDAFNCCTNCSAGCGSPWPSRSTTSTNARQDFLNNENALRERIEKAQARARQESQDRR